MLEDFKAIPESFTNDYFSMNTFRERILSLISKILEFIEQPQGIVLIKCENKHDSIDCSLHEN